jgi:hypothetical protein
VRAIYKYLATLVLLSIGCSRGPGVAGSATGGSLEPTRRDSAGVAMIEYEADALANAKAITMDSEAMAVLGGSEVKDDVTSLSMLSFLADGRVAGMDFDLTRLSIRVFDTTGTQVKAFGRPGEGPHEFKRVIGVAWGPGDTLAITDESLSRISFLHPTSGFIREQPAKLHIGGAIYAAAGRLTDGSWLLRPASWAITGGGAHEIGVPPPPVPFGHLSAQAARDEFDSLGVVPGIETAYVNKEKTGVATPRFSTPSMVVGWGGQAAVITNRARRVERVDDRGRLTATVTIKGLLRAVTAAMIDSAITTEVRRRLSRDAVPGAGAEAKLTARLHEWPSKKSLPPFGEVRSGPDGILWLPEYAVPGEPFLHITALGPDGLLLGRLTLSADKRVEAFGAGRLLLRTTDADGIVRFEVHRLRLPQ